MISHTLQTDEHFHRVRRFLIETYPITPLGFNWEVRRWDGKRYHDECPLAEADWIERVNLWQTGNGRLVGRLAE